jgi:flagellin-like hook-associated protein FlgL
MSSDITLTASIRSNLLSLQNASSLLDITSERLSTGKKVNSALDNPSSFFTARGLTNRASDLSARKDGLGQAISLLQATDKSINSITSLIEQAKATAQSAEEASTNGVSQISTTAASFSGAGEIGVTNITTEAAAAASTTNTETLSFSGNITNATTTSTMINWTGVTVTAGDDIVFTSPTGTYGNTTTVVTITGTDTIANMIAALNVNTGISASWNATTYDIDIVALKGGSQLNITTVGVDFLTRLSGNTFTGESTPVTSATIVGTNQVTFNTFGTGADLAAAAFNVSDADGTQSITISNGVTTNTRVVAAVELLTVDQYTANLMAADTAMTATYDASTRKIVFSGTNGTRINFANQTENTDLGLLQSGGSTLATAATNYSLDDGTAIAATDLLTTIFDGTTASETLQFSTTGGSTGTAYTVIASSTIADLVAAINASDSALTAAFNTTTSKIDIAAADGTEVKITSGSTTTAFTAMAWATSAGTAAVSGTGITYGAAGSAAEVGSLNTDFQSILEQVDKLIADASYKGNNLLKGSNSSVVKFNEDGSSSITVQGLDLGVTSNTTFKFTKDANGYDFTSVGDITQALTDTAAAIANLRTISATFGADMGVIQTREDFTTELVNVLESGAGKLVDANLEEESANMLALQTRQALGIQALSISNQSNQSILSLFR